MSYDVLKNPAATPPTQEPDAHGQAALLLAESTLHMLVEKGLFTNQEACTTISMAAEVKQELATLTGESRSRMQESLDLLWVIKASFATDLRLE